MAFPGYAVAASCGRLDRPSHKPHPLGFRVVHYSIQHDHVHFLIEAEGQQALANGMKSVGSRLGKAVNRVFGRKGQVIKERFHHRVMRTPRDVRNGLRCVLLNARKHYKKDHGKPPPGYETHLDAASSGHWFTGWRVRPPPSDEEPRIRDVATARTWLLTKGWRLHHRLIDPADVPTS